MEKTTVLIAEDESIVAMEIQDTLERLGYSVIAAVDTGEEVIKEAIDQKPDIVLMDIRLKGDLDGIGAAETIRSKADIPVIFITTNAEADMLKRANLTLPFGYILKPVQERELKVTLEFALYTVTCEAKRRQAINSFLTVQDELEDKVKKRTIELKKAKDEAEAANRAKSDFLSNISHELRTPMHHILSFSKFGMKKTGLVPDSEIIDYFNTIWESGNGLLNLLNSLLDLSKLESGKTDYNMTKSSLADISKEIINECRSTSAEKNILVELCEQEKCTVVICDVEKIRQVIRNLLANALKFSPAGKKIVVSIKEGHMPVGHNGDHNNSVSCLRLTVKDQGTGIPEDELELVFDKFVQSGKTITELGGTGLGLAICKEIIQAHHGRIWAENNPQGGAMFSFLLPCRQEETGMKPGNGLG